jgi:hypothetical protein
MEQRLKEVIVFYRLPDKPDPDIPGPTIEDNDSISIIKKISKDPEMNINNTESISTKTSTSFFKSEHVGQKKCRGQSSKTFRKK